MLFEELTEMNGKPLPALFEGQSKRLLPVYNSSVVYSSIFVSVGKMIAHSIVQCGVGFPYLAPCAYWYLVTDNISKAIGYATIEDVRDIEVVQAITKVITNNRLRIYIALFICNHSNNLVKIMICIVVYKLFLYERAFHS